jgi:hypothetical protein
VIEPTFEAGSGWYKPGAWAPGSASDVRGKRAALWPCTVIVMREFGMRLPPAVLLDRNHPAGGLLCHDLYTAPSWTAQLWSMPDMARELLRPLLDARLARESDGVRLYQGGNRLDGQTVRQTWLCVPDLARGLEILRSMDWRAPG